MLDNRKLTLFLIIPMILALTACPSRNTDHWKWNYQNPVTTTTKWSPKGSTYTCADPQFCPDNQGVLLSVRDIVVFAQFGTPLLKREIFRCTASMYEAQKGLTAGHCADQVEKSDKSYFVSVAQPGHPSRIYDVKGIVGKHHEGDAWTPDYGAFELTEPVTAVNFARPATAIPEDGAMMIALVSNAGSDEKHFVLNAVHCRNSKENGVEPIAYSERPNVFLLQDCKLFSGNSGGAVVPPDDLTQVLGTLQISDNAQMVSKSILRKFLLNIGLFYQDSPKFDFGAAANARCFQLPGWPRSESSCMEISTPMLRGLNLARAKTAIAKMVHQSSEEWLESADGHANFENSSLRLVPEMYLLQIINGASVEPVFALIPMPFCFENAPANEFRFQYGAKLYRPGFDKKMGTVFHSEPKEARISISLSRIGNEDYLIKYQSSDYPAMQPEEKAKKLFAGYSDVIKTCSGLDDRSAMNP